ncbi:MAG: hypothetical protein LUC86_05495 [Prevotellaceae bacterium]|nr:hypothetical protein [Prevotellaceae bacterium]MCD8285052.1 hypothetical protein [Prevotellaceae bacterium]MCD8304263.1 hypothetical protein [Prevotellaceae bacterium]
MRKYIKPSTEATSTETERMTALSAISSGSALHYQDNPDGDGLVRGSLWDSLDGFWD